MALFEQDSQFSHILNPIRDLTKNWNVDIAFYLEEYLNELEHISISFDGGKTTMNFVQAALLIQGSACVYGKKVDFLYNLVLQLLDVLKTNQLLMYGKERRPNENKNKDGGRGDGGDQYAEFAPLDITASDNIDIKEENEAPVKTIPRNFFHRLKSDKNEKGDFQITNAKGDLVGNKNDFNIHFNRIHRSGTSLQSLIMYTAVCLGKNGQSFSKAVATCEATNDANHNIADGDDDNQPATNGDVTSAATDFLPNDDGGCSSDDDRGGDEGIDSHPPAAPAEKTAEISKTYDMRKRKDLVTAADKALLDWKCANPQESVPSKLKTAQKAANKPLRVRKFKSIKKKLKMEGEEEVREDISDFCKNAFFSHAHKLSKDAHKHPNYSFLDQAFYEEMKRRKLEQRLLKPDNDGEESDGSERDFGDDGGAGDFGDLCDNNEPITMPDISNRVPPDGQTSDEFDDLLGMSNVNNTTNYEDLVNKFKGGVFEPYERITGIAKKVKDWEESLLGQLEDEETHASFDIQTYCTKIINKFSVSNQKETINFSKVIKGENSNEVARYFLATLQLANNSNIDISREDGTVGANAVHLTLLSRRQHFQQIDEFQT